MLNNFKLGYSTNIRKALRRNSETCWTYGISRCLDLIKTAGFAAYMMNLMFVAKLVDGADVSTLFPICLDRCFWYFEQLCWDIEIHDIHPQCDVSLPRAPVYKLQTEWRLGRLLKANWQAGASLWLILESPGSSKSSMCLEPVILFHTFGL